MAVTGWLPCFLTELRGGGLLLEAFRSVVSLADELYEVAVMLYAVDRRTLRHWLSAR